MRARDCPLADVGENACPYHRDELAEVIPKAIRLQKNLLHPTDREKEQTSE